MSKRLIMYNITGKSALFCFSLIKTPEGCFQDLLVYNFQAVIGTLVIEKQTQNILPTDTED